MNRLGRGLGRGLGRRLKDQSGVGALIIAALIATIAFSALAVFLNSYIGDRSFERARSTAKSSGVLVPSVLAYYNDLTTLPAHTVRTLPCPDTKTAGAIDGHAVACSTSASTSGVLPWADLGLSRDAAIDPFGNYYTYVVSGVGQKVCSTVTSDLPGGTPTSSYTGALVDPTDLTLTDSAGGITHVAFAIIGHGPNQQGAVNATSGTVPTRSSPGPGPLETANAGASPATIYAGPYSTTAASYFDDQVSAPSKTDLRTVCDNLTPGGKLNADIAENFGGPGTTLDTTKFDTTGSGTPPTQGRDATGNGVAIFSGPTSYAASAASYNFNSKVRPIYGSVVWTPSPNDPNATQAGFSLGTRATLPPTAGDDLPTGITFRFDSRTAATSSSSGVANSISIRNASAQLVSSGASTYNIINGKSYLLEIYDNGDVVWMRATQIDNTANSVFLTTSGTSALSQGGSQRVVWINSVAPSYMDDAVVGFPMLSLQTGPSAGYAATAAAANGTNTGDITVEAWINPHSLPTSGQANIVSQWDTTSPATSSFRLYIDGADGDKIKFDMSGSSAQTVDLGVKPTLNTWTHLAVTYGAAAKVLKFYQKDELMVTATGTLSTAGIRQNGQRFVVGAALTGGTPGGFFDGEISDVRIWAVTRSTTEVETNYSVRLPINSDPTGNLVVNWRFDGESGTAGGNTAVIATPAVGANGTLTGATYAPALATYFRPLSTTFCPAGTIAAAYQCDFRSAGTRSLTVPKNLASVYAKLWGAGGGYTPIIGNGGGGAFAGATLPNEFVTMTLTVGVGGPATTDGGDTSSTQSTVVLIAKGGPSGLGGILGGIFQILTDALNVLGLTHADGANPDAGNNTDPYYNPTYLVSPPNPDPGRGGTSGSQTGHDGTAVLFW